MLLESDHLVRRPCELLEGVVEEIQADSVKLSFSRKRGWSGTTAYEPITSFWSCPENVPTFWTSFSLKPGPSGLRSP